MKHFIIMGMVAILTLATGCTKKSVVAKKDAQIAEQGQELAELQERMERLQSELATQRQLNEDLQADMEDLRAEKRVWIKQREGLTHITLDGAANFASARADLTKEAKEVIDRIHKTVGKYPDRWILIEGHADNRPISTSYQSVFKSNWELSSARAHAVLHYMVDQRGADPSRIRAVGCGIYNPIADNSTVEGRAKNRRVVITIGSERAVKTRAARRTS